MLLPRLRLFSHWQRSLAAIAILLSGSSALAEFPDRSNAVIENLLAIKSVSGLSLSPDGSMAVYELASNDRDTDKVNYDIWVVDTVSGVSTRLTHTDDSEWAPTWHGGGEAIGFLSDRHDTDQGLAQVWLQPMGPGEARRVTDFDNGVEDFVFSADGNTVAVISPEDDPFEAAEEGDGITTAPPIVIDRFAFKTDSEGYRTRERELFVADIDDGEPRKLAETIASPSLPAFSPDGKSLAFVARAGEEPDRGDNFDVYVIAVEGKALPRVVADTTEAICSDQRPVWSPDGTAIACTSMEYDRDGYFAQYELVLIDVAGAAVDMLTGDLDLNVYRPRFSNDGRSIYVTIEDDMSLRLAKIELDKREWQSVHSGDFSVDAFELGPKGAVTALISSIDHPAAIFQLKNGAARQLTDHNDQLLSEQPWQGAERISFESADGTEVHGLLMRPQGRKLHRAAPAVLWLHGGPTAQFAFEARIEPQLFAAHGYAVIMLNPRGSTGRGLAYAKALMGAWGSVDVPDVLAGVDHVVKMGVADPDRLHIGGWSYGGMLTNYVIASDTRFRSALSGAGIGNAWAGFGTDMYVREYLIELGRPWENPEAYNGVSYPFLHADRIKTPTLFQVGEDDYNVPLLASEQMYQALRVLDVPTQLVIYPGQSHGLSPPSYQADCYQRYLDWFDRYR
jgi:dipeptidyl aminopeptidase/acylaminoacyl peptidase